MATEVSLNKLEKLINAKSVSVELMKTELIWDVTSC